MNRLSSHRDPLVQKAFRAVVASRTPSISFLRRRFRIGYSRANRLMHDLCFSGVVSDKDLSGRRRLVLVMSRDITIRYVMMKDGGDGPWPRAGEMTRAEMDDPATMCHFNMEWDPDLSLIGDLDGVHFWCEVIYDGVTHVPGRSYGLRVTGRQRPRLKGYPAPIIRFHLSRKVNVRTFVNSAEIANLSVMPASRTEPDAEPFTFVDANGYTSEVTDDDARAWELEMKKVGLYSGRRLSEAELLSSIQVTDMRGPAARNG